MDTAKVGEHSYRTEQFCYIDTREKVFMFSQVLACGAPICAAASRGLSIKSLAIATSPHFTGALGQGLAQLNNLLLQLACPETWREGSTNSTVGKSGGKAARGVAENKLSKKSARHNPYGSQCELCKAVLHQQQAKYCHTCAYSKGAPTPFPSHLLQLSTQRSKGRRRDVWNWCCVGC